MAGVMGYPDAEMVNKMAQEEHIPDDPMQRMEWGLKKGWPLALITLANKADLLRQATELQQKIQQAQDKSTVADKVDQQLQGAGQGLAALTNPQPQQVAPPQMPPQMPPQTQQPQMPPQGAPAPGMYGGGLTSLHAGDLEDPKFVQGGIVTFKVGGDSEEGGEEQEPLTVEEAAEQNDIPLFKYTPAEEKKDGAKPTSDYGRAVAGLDKAQADMNALTEQRAEAAKHKMVYQKGIDPSIQEDIDNTVAEQLANEQKISKKGWKGLIAMADAMIEENNKVRSAGEYNPIVAVNAGFKAADAKIEALEKEYEANKKTLSKRLVELHHSQYEAAETNSEKAFNAVNQANADIETLWKENITLNSEIQKNKADYALRKQQADASSTSAAASKLTAEQGRTTDYTRAVKTEFDKLKYQRDNDPNSPYKGKSDQELEALASDHVKALDIRAQSNILRQQQLDDARVKEAQKAVDATLKPGGANYITYLTKQNYDTKNGTNTAEEYKQQLLDLELQGYNTSAGSSSSASSAPAAPPAQASAPSAAPQAKLVSVRR